MAAFEVLTNPSQYDIWWLTTAGRNSYQPVLVCTFRNCAIVEAWLPFMTRRICILRTLACQAEGTVSVHCGAIAFIASTTYMTIMELFDEHPRPLLP